MHALTIETDQSLKWSEVPEPELKGDFDVLLEVKACAVNRADLM